MYQAFLTLNCARIFFNLPGQNPLTVKSIPSQAFLPLLVKSAGAIMAFVLSVVLARVLGVAEFGAYSLVISTVMVLAIPIQSGLPTLATREVSRAQSAGHSAKIFAYIDWSNRVILTYFAVIGALVVLLCLAFLKHDYARNILVAVFSVFTIAVTLRNSAVSRGFGHFIKGSLPDVLLRPAVQLLVFVALFYFAEEMAREAPSALATYVGASMFAYLISTIWRPAATQLEGSSRGDENFAKAEEWRKAALFLTVVGGGQIFFGHIDTLMLGLLGSEREVGAYRVAVQLSMLVIFALTVVNQVLQPSLSRLHAQGDIAAFQKLVADSSLWMFLGTLIPALVLAFAAPKLLELVFGAEYRAAAPALQILILGQVINVFFGSVGTILNMTGLEKEAMRGMIIAIIINLALDLLLIPLMGLTGAALASALTITIWNLILRRYVKGRLGVESIGAIVHARRLLGRGNLSS